MEIRLRHATRTLAVTLADEADGVRAVVDGRAYHLYQVGAARPRTADGAEAAELLIAIDGETRRALVVRDGDRLLCALDGRVHAFALGDEPARGGGAGTGVGVTTAPMPGKIVRVLVSIGDVVEPGQPLVVLEAMKMETTLRAEVAGTVAALGAAAGEMVEAGAALVEIAPPDA